VSGCEHDRYTCARCVRAATSPGPGGGDRKVFTAERTEAGRKALAEHLDTHSGVGQRPGWIRRRSS
jgi:hypothetical protein